MSTLCAVLMLAGAVAAVAAPTAEVAHDMPTRSERIVRAFQDLTKDNLHILDGFYAPEVHFEDPLGSMDGLPELKAYYADMYKNVQSIRWDFHHEVVQDNEHVVFWTMHAKIKGLNRGREISLDGNSIIRFDAQDLVSYHRDYFDVGAMVYEHVPVLGCLVRKVKKRLQHD